MDLAGAALPCAGAAGRVRYPCRAATVVHHRIEAVAFLLEARQHRAFERTAARQLDPHRIDEAAVDQDFIMDVGAGRLSGRADKADDLSLDRKSTRLNSSHR